MRIVIGEDLFLLREGLVRLLTAHGFEVVAAVASAPELLRALVEERPAGIGVHAVQDQGPGAKLGQSAVARNDPAPR